MAIMDYRTQDGLGNYGFSIEFHADTGWRAYVVFVPLSLHYSDSLDLPYQSICRDGRRYVDWSSRLNTLGEARTVAALWAELVQRCHRTQSRAARGNVGLQRAHRSPHEPRYPGQ